MTVSERGVEFKYWPFGLVPAEGERLVWADRHKLRASIDLLGKRLSRHDAVSLHVLWADFGAGKTHALLYLKQEIQSGNYGTIWPTYSALPKGCRTFVDIYRSIVRSFSVGSITSAYNAAAKALGHAELHKQLDNVWLHLSRCLQTIAIGNEEQRNIAIGWLHGEISVPASQLQSLSIFSRIRSTDEAVLALTGVMRLFNLAGYSRVLIMVDEFQRVEELRRQQQDEINAGLHSFFNKCGKGMSLLLSFSFGEEEDIRHFLNAELLSRVDPLRISIPAMPSGDANSFLNEIILPARAPERPWPVANDFIPSLVGAVEKRFKLTPRRLIKAAGLTFDLGSIALEEGELSELNGTYVARLEAGGTFDQLDYGAET